MKLISESPRSERPRERLARVGSGALTTAELVALVLGTGDRGHDVLSLAHQVLQSCDGSLRRLARRPLAAIERHDGIGRAKAARLAAACELARRLAEEELDRSAPVASPQAVHAFMAPRLRDAQVEEFHVLCLDTQNVVVEDKLITKGILNGSLVHPREVFRVAIAEGAAGLIAVHNHPSGDPRPSNEDRSVTAQLVEAGKLLDIPLYDHLIIGSDSYFSFAEAGFL